MISMCLTMGEALKDQSTKQSSGQHLVRLLARIIIFAKLDKEKTSSMSIENLQTHRSVSRQEILDIKKTSFTL